MFWYALLTPIAIALGAWVGLKLAGRSARRSKYGPPLHEWRHEQDRAVMVCVACHEVMTWDGPNTNANGECYPCGKCGVCDVCVMTGVPR